MSDEPLPLPPPSKKRCTIYVDAFNWYYGIFVHRPEWKGLNIQSFFEHLRVDEDVTWMGFFSAIVEPQRHQSTKRDRQKRYLQALKARPKVEIVLGKYQERTVTCRALDCSRRLTYQVESEGFVRRGGLSGESGALCAFEVDGGAEEFREF